MVDASHPGYFDVTLWSQRGNYQAHQRIDRATLLHLRNTTARLLDEHFAIDGRRARVHQRLDDGTIEIEWLDTHTRSFVTTAQLNAGTSRPESEEGE